MSEPTLSARRGSADPDFVESWRRLWRRRWRSATTVFTLVLGLAAALIFLTHPIYRAEARLRLGEPPPMTGVSPTASVFGLMRMGGDPFANDLELLSSRTLAENTVEDAALNARLRAPRGWYRDSLFTVFDADRTTVKGSYHVAWQADGHIQVRRTSPTDSLIGDFAPGTRARFGGLTVVFRPRRPDLPRRVQISTIPFGLAVKNLRGHLQLERARREANVVDLAYDGDDPAVDRTVVASVVRRFIALRTDLQRRESTQTVDSLREVEDSTRNELRHAELALAQLQHDARLLEPEAQSTTLIKRYSETYSELEKLRSALVTVRSVLQRADSVSRSADAWTRLLAYPPFLENSTVGAMLQKLTELEGKRTELRARRTESSLEYRTLAEEIDYLDRSLRTLVADYAITLREQVGQLERQVAAMDVRMARAPAAAMEFARRQRDVRVLSEVVVMTEQRLRQEELREALTFANVQVVDPPALRYKPVWPRKKLGLAVGLMLAAVFGLLALVVGERADPGVRGAAEVRTIAGAPVLAAVAHAGTPTLATNERAAVWRAAAASNGARLRLTLVSMNGVETARRFAGALGAGGTPGDGGTEDGGAAIAVAGRVDSYADAVAAAALDAPVILIVEHGRTRRPDLSRSTRLLTEAGARIAGSIILCPRPDDTAAVWR